MKITEPIEITITMDDFKDENGNVRHFFKSLSCPLATAVKRIIGCDWVNVSDRHISLDDGTYSSHYHLSTPFQDVNYKHMLQHGGVFRTRIMPNK